MRVPMWIIPNEHFRSKYQLMGTPRKSLHKIRYWKGTEGMSLLFGIYLFVLFFWLRRGRMMGSVFCRTMHGGRPMVSYPKNNYLIRIIS